MSRMQKLNINVKKTEGKDDETERNCIKEK